MRSVAASLANKASSALGANGQSILSSIESKNSAHSGSGSSQEGSQSGATSIGVNSLLIAAAAGLAASSSLF